MRYADSGGLSRTARAKRETLRLEAAAGFEAGEDSTVAEHGWVEDQRWMLARIVTPTRELFGIEYTLRGMSYVLHRIGWSPQVPVHQAAERDEEAIATWVTKTSPRWSAPGFATCNTAPELLDGFIAGTGPTLSSTPP